MTDSDAVPAVPVLTPAPRPRLLARLARYGYVILALVCLLLWLPGVIRLPALDRDESRFAQSSRQMLESGDVVDIRLGQVPRYKKPVGIYWLQAAATAAAGFGDHSHIWTYRLPSLLGGIAAVWFTFWCGSLFGAEAGLLAGLLLAATLLLAAEATQATTDAVQLAAITAMQGVLLRIWRGAKDNIPPPSNRLVLAGWAALGVGILVKGPVAVAVAILTVVVISLWRKKEAAVVAVSPPEGEAAPPTPRLRFDFRGAFAWLAGTNPRWGLALTLLIVAPWMIAIALASHGAFFQQSLGNDFAAKLAEGQEGHGALPGYYLLLSAVTLWPAILFVLPGIVYAVGRRAEPAIRFLIVWAGAAWAMVEAVPTKLPNYVLPALPPLAILAALWLLAPKESGMAAPGNPLVENDADAAAATAPASQAGGWRKWLTWFSALQFTIGAVALIAVLVLLPQRYTAAAPGLSDDWVLLVLVLVAAISALTALAIFLTGRRLMALAPALLAALILFPALTAYVGPRLDQVWVSTRLAALVAKNRQASDPPPMLAGYEEPSMLFALGADVDLTDGKGAAEQGARGGGLALVDDEERPRFLARLAELEANATAVDELEGFNYSRGKRTHVTLYRVAPLDPSALPRVR